MIMNNNLEKILNETDEKIKELEDNEIDSVDKLTKHIDREIDKLENPKQPIDELLDDIDEKIKQLEENE